MEIFFCSFSFFHFIMIERSNESNDEDEDNDDENFCVNNMKGKKRIIIPFYRARKLIMSF